MSWLLGREKRLKLEKTIQFWICSAIRYQPAWDFSPVFMFKGMVIRDRVLTSCVDRGLPSGNIIVAYTTYTSAHATHISFSSPEAALLLVRTKNRDLWLGPTAFVLNGRLCKHNRWRPQPIRFVRLDSD